MVMASLAWSLKAWAALLLPEEGRWQEKHREEKRKLLRMDFTHVPRGDDAEFRRRFVSHGAEDRLPAVGVESLAARLLPSVGPTSPAAALLSAPSLKPESGCSGPPPP